MPDFNETLVPAGLPNMRWLDDFIEMQRILSRAPRLPRERNAIEEIIDLGPGFRGWSLNGAPLLNEREEVYWPRGADAGCLGTERPFGRPSGFSDRSRSATRVDPNNVLREVPGQLVRASEAPEQPMRSMSAKDEAEFMQLVARARDANELRAYVRDHGIPYSTDNFDEVLKARNDGATIPNQIVYEFPEPPANADGTVGAAGRGFADPFNFLDEAGAVVDVFGGTDGRQNVWNSDRSLKNLLYDNIDQNRAILKADERDHPWARTGGQIAGNLVLPIGNKARSAAQLAKWGAVEGGLAGFGGGEGSPAERLPNTAVGAAAGATLGYGLGRGLEKAAPLFDLSRSRMGFPRIGPHGPIYSHLANDYQAARDRLLAERTGEVPGLLQHPELGKIDVVWGNSDYGLAKIHDRHPEVWDDLPDIVKTSSVTQRPHETGNNRFVLSDEAHRSIVAPDFDGVPKQWLVSAYRKEGAPEGQTSRRDPLSPDGRSTGAEQRRSINVPERDGKSRLEPLPNAGPGDSPQQAIQVRTPAQLKAVPRGTWVEYEGRRFPKS